MAVSERAVSALRRKLQNCFCLAPQIAKLFLPCIASCISRIMQAVGPIVKNQIPGPQFANQFLPCTANCNFGMRLHCKLHPRFCGRCRLHFAFLGRPSSSASVRLPPRPSPSVPPPPSLPLRPSPTSPPSPLSASAFASAPVYVLVVVLVFVSVIGSVLG